MSSSKKGLSLGINGFGRIGKLALRAALSNPRVQVKAINDPFITNLDYLAYLLKYDSVHGRLDAQVEVQGENLVVDGQNIRVFHEKDPAHIPWGNLDVGVVAECSGAFLTQEKCQTHLLSGAKKVVMSAPAGDKITPTYVYGVNHHKYTSDQDIVSNASCTTNCLAPLAHIMHSKWGIEEGLMTTVHAVTATQTTVDAAEKKGKDWRAGRSSLLNIIPSTTGAAKAVGLVIPQLNGKLTGMAFRVPTADVSVVDLTLKLNNPATYEQICQEVKLASQTYLKGVMGYTDDQVVSQDFVHEKLSSVFDAKAGVQLSEKFVKLISWYDNEWGYSNRLIDLAEHISKTSNLSN